MKSKSGRVFGGFAEQSWDSDTEDFKADENAFIFSIDRQQIYRAINSQNALYCKANWGPCFGSDSLGLVGDQLN
jgi:hypothetical protein